MENKDMDAKGAKVGIRGVGAFLAILTTSCTMADADTARCIPTSADALGPYYVAGTAVTDNLNRFGKSGDLLLVEGAVLSSSDGQSPIGDVSIEVWQTDGDGDYFPENNGHVGDYPDDDIDMRGTVVTDEAGRYRYETVVPGAYFPRPRHLHYRITAPGHRDLVTQLYMTGDGVLKQPGGNCRHASLEADGEGFRYAAPTIYLDPE